MHKLFWGALIVLAPAVSFAVACSSNPPPPAPDAGPQLCPPTLVQASTMGGDAGEGTNSSCHVQGYSCFIGFACGSFIQQADCTCTLPDAGGPMTFACQLTANGSEVPPDPTMWGTPGDPSKSFCVPLPNIADAGVECPDASVAATTATPCNAAGEICYYKGVTCPGDQVPIKTDNCQCNANVQGDAGLSWMCDIHTCN